MSRSGDSGGGDSSGGRAAAAPKPQKDSAAADESCGAAVAVAVVAALAPGRHRPPSRWRWRHPRDAFASPGSLLASHGALEAERQFWTVLIQ
jgi:hypothetical protein